MRISDWSSDVCSSDLFRRAEHIACVISGWCGQYHPIEFLQPCPPFVCPNDAVGMIGQAAHAGDLNLHGLQSRTVGPTYLPLADNERTSAFPLGGARPLGQHLPTITLPDAIRYALRQIEYAP